MKKNLTTKTLLIVGIMLVFLFGIFGIPRGVTPQALKASLAERIHLGLDLKGGTHLILQVIVNDAIGSSAAAAVERLKDELGSSKISFSDVSKPDPNQPDRIQVKGVLPDATTELRRIVEEKLPEYDLNTGADNSYVLNMKPQVITDRKNRAVTQTIDTIRSRVDALGIGEAVIEEHGLGDHQILVQLPGVDDPTRVKEIMQSTAMLEIRQEKGGPYGSEQEALTANGGAVPADTVLMHGSNVLARGEASQDQVYLISRVAAVGGTDIRDAQPGRDETGRPSVTFVLTGDGGKRFASFTASHIGENLAIVLDNKVREVAVIRSQISDSGQIAGAFTEQQAHDLSTMLRSGALPASIHYLEERTVGPSLGAESIRQGITASIIGMAAVMIFMFVYYRGAGINANLALLLNLIILLGFLGFFHEYATLTLPGIAGVILTIGMGVDSNVLIFERIREELRNGKSPASAVDQGFAKAWLTIIDTHVTTIVSAVILFLFGSGPVRGFAVTLTFGLLANIFTAVYVSRVIFDAVLARKGRGEALSI